MESNREKRNGTPGRPAVVAGIVGALVLLSLLGGGMVLGPAMMLGGPLLLIGGPLLLIWLLRGGGLAELTSAGDRPRGDRALDVLRERYARGELSDEQYDRMRRDLG